MIRFIDLTDKIDEYSKEFAFFDTVNGKFIECNGSQSWTRIEDFVKDFSNEDLNRYLSLIPVDWASDNQNSFEKLIYRKQQRAFEFDSHDDCILVNDAISILRLVRKKTIQECILIAKDSLFLSQSDIPLLALGKFHKMGTDSVVE